MKYLIVYEKTATGFVAHSPDVPGCIATGATKPEVAHNIKEAIAFHLEGLALQNIGAPEAVAQSEYLEVVASLQPFHLP